MVMFKVRESDSINHYQVMILSKIQDALSWGRWPAGAFYLAALANGKRADNENSLKDLLVMARSWLSSSQESFSYDTSIVRLSYYRDQRDGLQERASFFYRHCIASHVSFRDCSTTTWDQVRIVAHKHTPSVHHHQRRFEEVDSTQDMRRQ